MNKEINILYTAYSKPASRLLKFCDINEVFNGMPISKDTTFYMYVATNDVKGIKSKELISARRYDALVLDCVPDVIYTDAYDTKSFKEKYDIAAYGSRVLRELQLNRDSKPLVALIGEDAIVKSLANEYVCSFNFAPVRKGREGIEVYCSGLVNNRTIEDRDPKTAGTERSRI